MTETFSKPGIADVTPADYKKLKPLVDHYASMAHPFTVCVRDQIKHGLSKDHANRRCAVIKKLGGRKLSQLSSAEQAILLSMTDEQIVRAYWAADLSLAGTGLEATANHMLLAQGARFGEEWNHEEFQLHLDQKRQEILDTEAQVGYTSSMNLAVFKWEPHEHPRNFLGRFIDKLDHMSPGGSVQLPDGTSVHKEKSGRFRIGVGKSKIGPSFKKSDSAAKKAMDISAGNTHPDALGGDVAYDDRKALTTRIAGSQLDDHNEMFYISSEDDGVEVHQVTAGIDDDPIWEAALYRNEDETWGLTVNGEDVGQDFDNAGIARDALQHAIDQQADTYNQAGGPNDLGDERPDISALNKKAEDAHREMEKYAHSSEDGATEKYGAAYRRWNEALDEIQTLEKETDDQKFDPEGDDYNAGYEAQYEAIEKQITDAWTIESDIRRTDYGYEWDNPEGTASLEPLDDGSGWNVTFPESSDNPEQVKVAFGESPAEAIEAANKGEWNTAEVGDSSRDVYVVAGLIPGDHEMTIKAFPTEKAAHDFAKDKIGNGDDQYVNKDGDTTVYGDGFGGEFTVKKQYMGEKYPTAEGQQSWLNAVHAELESRGYDAGEIEVGVEGFGSEYPERANEDAVQAADHFLEEYKEVTGSAAPKKSADVPDEDELRDELVGDGITDVLVYKDMVQFTNQEDGDFFTYMRQADGGWKATWFSEDGDVQGRATSDSSDVRDLIRKTSNDGDWNPVFKSGTKVRHRDSPDIPENAGVVIKENEDGTVDIIGAGAEGIGGEYIPNVSPADMEEAKADLTRDVAQVRDQKEDDIAWEEDIDVLVGEVDGFGGEEMAQAVRGYLEAEPGSLQGTTPFENLSDDEKRELLEFVDKSAKDNNAAEVISREARNSLLPGASETPAEVNAAILKRFPAEDLQQHDGDNPSWSWTTDGEEYSLDFNPEDYEDGTKANWQVSKFYENEDWQTYADTMEEALQKAASGEWDDHGRML